MEMTHTMLTRNRWFHCVTPVLAAFGMLFVTSSAFAACGNMTGLKPGPPINLPMLAPEIRTIEPSSATQISSESNNTIVGLWHVVYTAGGETFNQSLDEWHSDGTEFENAYLPPATGNICFGVWKLVGPATVRLHHIGLMFNPDGSIAGTFTIDETDKVVDNGQKYQGEFDFKVYDTNGNFTGIEVQGTIAAARITVE